MSLQPIDVPDSVHKRDCSAETSSLIDDANDRIEAFMLADQVVIENFVTCDFHLVAQAMDWIKESHLLTGDRFCELGSGFGVVAMLAAIRDMESVGIEIESVLVEQSSDLADYLSNSAKFYRGSFVPREADDVSEAATDVEHVQTQTDDVFDEVGLSMGDFDLFFAFPWPGEHTVFEDVFDRCAADGALLLTYRGRDGVNLVRKSSTI